MGPQETELRNITAAGEWRSDELTLLSDHLQDLTSLLGKLSAEPGWDGTSATAASSSASTPALPKYLCKASQSCLVFMVLGNGRIYHT